MTTRLCGKIAHAVDLSKKPVIKDDDGSRKRKRSSNAATTTDPIPRDDDLPLCGFVFLPRHSQNQYLLSVPREMLRQAYKAAISGCDVCLCKFQEISYCNHNETEFRPTVSLLEIHLGGIEMPQQNSQKAIENAPQDVWTLTQWWRKEMVDAVIKATKSRAKVSIVVTIDAISPVITLDADNPFALVEVYDRNNTDVSSVVVMKGKAALVAHSAILAVDTVIFSNLVYKAWSIPAIFQKEAPHLVGRIPSHVFVATESDCVSWDLSFSGEGEVDNSAIPPAITPVNLLTKIRGIIQNVQTRTESSGKGNHSCVRYIDVSIISPPNSQQSTDQNSKTAHCRLYLAHFPMSISFQMSLRKGAVIEASNVHQILDTSGSCPPLMHVEGEMIFVTLVYGACLRSTLSLVRCASDTASNTTGHQQPSATAMSSSPFPFQNYSFRKIKETYHQMVYGDHVKKWAQENFRASTDTLPVRWIVETLMSGFQRNGGEKEESSYSRKAPSRSPYAEFFDHPHELSGVGIDSMGKSSGCAFSKEDWSRDDFSSASMVGLDEIRRASQEYFIEKVRERAKKATIHPINTGWSGTVFVGVKELFLGKGKDNGERRDRATAGNGSCYVGGFVSELGSHAVCGNVVAVRDGACHFPVSVSEEQDEEIELDDFVLGKLASVSVSCLCIASSKTNSGLDEFNEATGESIGSSSSLPALVNGNMDLLGGCSLVSVNGFLFVTCAQLHCHAFVVRGKSAPRHEKGEAFFAIDQVIELDLGSKSQSLQREAVQGMIVRRKFRHKMQSDGLHKGCELEVANAPLSEKNKDDLDSSRLQSINVSICLKQNTAMILRLTEMINHAWQKGTISDAQKATAASFWSVGDSGRSCALLVGGIEDLASYSAFSAVQVRICFPVSALERTALGFVWARCKKTELCAYIRSNQGSTEGQATTSNEESVFDFETKPQRGKGLLHASLRRRRVNTTTTGASFERVTGELLAKPSDVIPKVNLSEIFDRMCRFLRQPEDVNLSPSLVQRIPNARLLGISFCQVQAYCTQCSSSLLDGNRKRRAGISYLENDDEPSFWHLPDPTKAEGNTVRPEHGCGNTALKFPYNEDIRRSFLRCPNQCPLHFYSAKWECSGTVDDGTGQATVYADDNIALTLLGMSKETIGKIEKGIWHIPDGVLTFKKTVPPSKHLRAAIQNVLVRRVSAAAEQTRLLSVPLRAEYLLQMHCRMSTQPRRPLDYYVRCKPLPDKLQHLHHTSLDSFFGADNAEEASVFHVDVSSYSLPSLKLELVDCGVPWE